MSESDTIQLAIPADETDVRFILWSSHSWIDSTRRSKQLIPRKIQWPLTSTYVKPIKWVGVRGILLVRSDPLFFVAAYSNIRSALKLFFDKFELSLQRLSLRLEQAICILKGFENFMFIYAINLSGNVKRQLRSLCYPSFFCHIENNLTDGIFEQLAKLSLDQLKSLNLARNKFTSNGIRKLFDQKLMVQLWCFCRSSDARISSF